MPSQKSKLLMTIVRTIFVFVPTTNGSPLVGVRSGTKVKTTMVELLKLGDAVKGLPGDQVLANVKDIDSRFGVPSLACTSAPWR